MTIIIVIGQNHNHLRLGPIMITIFSTLVRGVTQPKSYQICLFNYCVILGGRRRRQAWRSVMSLRPTLFYRLRCFDLDIFALGPNKFDQHADNDSLSKSKPDKFVDINFCQTLNLSTMTVCRNINTLNLSTSTFAKPLTCRQWQFVKI